MHKFFLKQRVLPMTLFYAMLPRTIYYWPMVRAFIFSTLLILLIAGYLIQRVKILTNFGVKKSLIFLDSGLAVGGIILASLLSHDTGLAMWCVLAAVPLLINNYRTVTALTRSQNTPKESLQL